MQLLTKAYKRFITAAILLALITSTFSISSANESIDIPMKIGILDGNIVIWGNSYSNQALKNPLVLINGVIYYPLTPEFTQVLGFSMHQTENNEVILTRRSSIGKNMITERSFGSPSSSSILNLSSFQIRASGYTLYSEKPIYQFANVPYVAIEFTPILRSKITIQANVDLEILTETTYNKRYPTAYNTYDKVDQSNFVRDQGSAASCWAFAANTLFELAVEKQYHETLNFSESHLIENTPIKSTYASGGNFQASSIYFLNKKGPVIESTTRAGSESALDRVPYQLDEYLEFNNNINKMKENIIENGAVLTSIYLNESDEAVYNQTTNAYFNSNDKKGRTHELVLVGWDDQYSKLNFTESPTKDGAFIAQNSFGNSWGDNGFFYVSYEDVHIKEYVYAIDKISPLTDYSPSKESYYYDTTGVTHYENFNDAPLVTGINNFTAKSDSILTQVGIYNNEENIHISIYTGNSKFPMSLDQSPIYETKLLEKGYHTLTLPVGLPLIKDEKFWVAVKYEGKQNFILPIEAPYPGISYNVFAAPGQGFIGSETNFVDLTEIRPNASVAIRAFAFPVTKP